MPSQLAGQELKEMGLDVAPIDAETKAKLELAAAKEEAKIQQRSAQKKHTNDNYHGRI